MLFDNIFSFSCLLHTLRKGYRGLLETNHKPTHERTLRTYFVVVVVVVVVVVRFCFINWFSIFYPWPCFCDGTGDQGFILSIVTMFRLPTRCQAHLFQRRFPITSWILFLLLGRSEFFYFFRCLSRCSSQLSCLFLIINLIVFFILNSCCDGFDKS